MKWMKRSAALTQRDIDRVDRPMMFESWLMFAVFAANMIVLSIVALVCLAAAWFAVVVLFSM